MPPASENAQSATALQTLHDQIFKRVRQRGADDDESHEDDSAPLVHARGAKQQKSTHPGVADGLEAAAQASGGGAHAGAGAHGGLVRKTRSSTQDHIQRTPGGQVWNWNLRSPDREHESRSPRRGDRLSRQSSRGQKLAALVQRRASAPLQAAPLLRKATAVGAPDLQDPGDGKASTVAADTGSDTLPPGVARLPSRKESIGGADGRGACAGETLAARQPPVAAAARSEPRRSMATEVPSGQPRKPPVPAAHERAEAAEHALGDGGRRLPLPPAGPPRSEAPDLLKPARGHIHGQQQPAFAAGPSQAPELTAPARDQSRSRPPAPVPAPPAQSEALEKTAPSEQQLAGGLSVEGCLKHATPERPSSAEEAEWTLLGGAAARQAAMGAARLPGDSPEQTLVRSPPEVAPRGPAPAPPSPSPGLLPSPALPLAGAAAGLEEADSAEEIVSEALAVQTEGLEPQQDQARGVSALFREAASALEAALEDEEASRVCSEMKRLLPPKQTGSHDHSALEASLRAQAPQWLPCLERSMRLLDAQNQVAEERARNLEPESVLRDARMACLTVGHALRHMDDAAGVAVATDAATLKDELHQFVADGVPAGTSSGPMCSGCLSGREAADAATHLWKPFGGVTAYAAFLSQEAKVDGADDILGGNAAWGRLLAEIEVAMLLGHPGDGAAAQVQRAEAQWGFFHHGCQTRDSLATKLMMGLAFPALHPIARYAAARVLWALRRRVELALGWMQTLGENWSGEFYSPLLPKCHATLRSRPVVAALVRKALDDAAVAAAARMLASLEKVLTAGCHCPGLLLLPATTPQLEEKLGGSDGQEKPGGSGEQGAALRPDAGATRRRVQEEMRRRAAASEGMPPLLALVAGGFCKLRASVAHQAVGFAQAALSSFSSRLVDEMACSGDFGQERLGVLRAEHQQHVSAAEQAERRCGALRRCEAWLREGQPPLTTNAERPGSQLGGLSARGWM